MRQSGWRENLHDNTNLAKGYGFVSSQLRAFVLASARLEFVCSPDDMPTTGSHMRSSHLSQRVLDIGPGYPRRLGRSEYGCKRSICVGIGRTTGYGGGGGETDWKEFEWRNVHRTATITS